MGCGDMRRKDGRGAPQLAEPQRTLALISPQLFDVYNNREDGFKRTFVDRLARPHQISVYFPFLRIQYCSPATPVLSPWGAKRRKKNSF